jgi:hypothetical protein
MAAMQTCHAWACKKTALRRIRTPRRLHLEIIDHGTPLREGTKMTKLIAIAAAFVLFAPIAVAILAQAARIVA